MTKETIHLKQDKMTLRRMKELMKHYSTAPVVSMETWKDGKKALVALKEQLHTKD